MLCPRTPLEESIHFGKNVLIRVADMVHVQPKSSRIPQPCFFVPFCAASMCTCLSGPTMVSFLWWIDLRQ